MITIEVLREIGFFDKIQTLKNLYTDHSIKEIYITPSIHLNNENEDPYDCYICLECVDSDNDNPASYIKAYNAICEVLEPLFSVHKPKYHLFPVDTLELVEDDADYYPIYQNALKSAIPIGELRQDLTLELQWEMQRFIKNPPHYGFKLVNSTDTSAVIFSDKENQERQYFADDEDSDYDPNPDYKSAQHARKKRKIDPNRS